MPLRSKRGMWLSVVVVAAIAAGCGDDPSAPPAGHLQPVVGCEAIDPSPCDVFDSACQTKLMDLASCMRESSAQPLPPVSRMTESEYVQLLTDEIQADVPPPGLDQYEHALTLLHLVVAGAFKPASMAAMRASRVAGFYRSDMDDIVLIDRGMPAADADTNTVLLHELVHALQDRDQDLPTWYDARTDTYDATLASMSVVEGEARLHQERFAESVFGLDPRTVDLAKHFDGAIHLSETWVRMQPSPYLASYSAFPYEFGARLLLPRFVQDGPQAIAHLFAACRVHYDHSAPAATKIGVLIQEAGLPGPILEVTIDRPKANAGMITFPFVSTARRMIRSSSCLMFPAGGCTRFP